MAKTSPIPRIALVAVKDPASRRLLCKLLRELGVDDVTDVEDVDHAILQLRHGAKAFQLICCDTLGGDGHLELLKFVRWQDTLPRTIPVLCVADLWSAERLGAARDAGASAMLSWPLPRHALQVALSALASSGKPFIDSPTFRGTCRRVARISGYKGPFRRKEDEQFGRGAEALRGGRAVAEAKPAKVAAPAAPQASVLESGSAVGTPVESAIWGNAVDTGIPDIDGDHKRLRESLVRLGLMASRGDPAEAVRPRIAALIKLVQQHFGREEMIMSSFGYAEMERHKETHAHFLAEIRKFADDLDRNGRSPKMDALVVMANWLNSHIAADDVGYVRAMLKGDLKSQKNPASRQASIVLHGAFELTAVIDELRGQLNAANAAQSPSARWIRRKLFDATEKLANLLMLVPEGGEQWPQLGDNLQSGFRRVRASFYAAAADMAAVRVDKIITEAEEVVKAGAAIPFGISAKLALRWTAVEALSMLMGGGGTLDDELRLKFFRATELIRRVTELEGERCQLIDFGVTHPPGEPVAEPLAEYQAGVIDRLALGRSV